jgi:hypothetical protein
MVQSDYNTLVTRNAQAALLAFGNVKAAAQAGCAGVLDGMRTTLLPNLGTCINVLLWTANPKVAPNSNRDIYQIAWLAHVADVKAKIATLP